MKCIYCKHNFKSPTWNNEYEQKRCFSCRTVIRMLKGLQLSMGMSSISNAKSSDYWNSQINQILSDESNIN